MKYRIVQSWSVRFLTWGSVAIFVLLPFHAFLTVWAASVLGHYTALRLWPEVLLLAMFVAGIKLLFVDPKLRKSIFTDRLTQLIVAFAGLTIVSGLIARLAGGVSKSALADGIILNLRFLLFFALVWLVGHKTALLRQWWRQLLLGPAALVVAIGLLQRFLLPYDVLKHFGYNPNTIYPYETVDHKRAYLRVQSTLRGANPLGAYLVLVISAVASWLWQRANRYRWVLFAFAVGATLFYSYSRSALIGAGLSVGVLVYSSVRSRAVRRGLVVGAAIFVLLGVGAGLALRHNDLFQNTILHTDEHSTSSESSNLGHLEATKNGLRDVATHPLGGGTGTAGPASTHNSRPARIAEDYFIQIAQETGWLGLALFLAIYYLVAKRLWQRRSDDLALLLFVSLVGLTLVNLLSHAWTDDTLAYVWWGLAGLALAPPTANREKS